MVLETKLQTSKTKLLVLEVKLHPSGGMELPALEWGWKVCKMGLKKKKGTFLLKTRPK